MHYTSFRIQNFKGIKDTTINLTDQSKMGIFPFVGLNESGKTTILEAIHSFSPDHSTERLLNDSSGIEAQSKVPRHLISNFEGDVSVTAFLEYSDTEKVEFIKHSKAGFDIIIDPSTFPNKISLALIDRFQDGDFKESTLILDPIPSVKSGRQSKWRSPSKEELEIIIDNIYDITPDIAYFPTFVFDFPDRIFLTSRHDGKTGRFYRQVFQDILDYDGQGHTIEKSIVNRIRKDDYVGSWLNFLPLFSRSKDKEKIQHVIDRASSVVSSVVFGRWNDIFGEDASGKEISISFDTVEGSIFDKKTQTQTKTDDHDLYIKFQIKDGTRRFDVNDRSLGFRWFFAFMLFTQFRVARERKNPIMFLFDEPASNLHAAAQKKLIDSFPEITKNNDTLIYTTHSHYMIEPKWLEQTFIVTNRADAPAETVIGSLSLNDESLDVTATRYKAFVNSYPTQSSYFQPILDRLQVVPSRFDIEKTAIILEGKSDYYILRYATELLKLKSTPLVPGFGAGNFGPLISLHVGWNLSMTFVFDSDKKGTQERDKYVTEYGLNPTDALCIGDIVEGVTDIEDLLDCEAITVISRELEITSAPTKNQIRRFFQENLGKNTPIPLGKAFETKARELIEKLSERSLGI